MSCEKCDKCSNKKSTYRSDDEKKRLTKRLNIIEGQIKGINQMIVDDRYCDDVLIQIAAVTKALQSLGNHVLNSHLKNCVANEVKSGNLDILDDVMKLIRKIQ